MSQFFTSGGQRIGASASVLPMNIQGWFPLGLIDWFDLLAVQGTLKSLLQYHNSKASILRRSAFYMIQLSHSYMTTEKTTALTIQTIAIKVISLLCNMLSRMIMAFYFKEQASFNFMAAVTICSDLGAWENSLSLFPSFPHLFTMKWWDQMPWSSFFECWVSSQLFHTPLSPSSRGSLVPLFFPQ